MVKNTIGTLAIVFLVSMPVFVPVVSAQVVTKSAVTDSEKIQSPDPPPTPMKSIPEVDFRGLRMGQKSEGRAKPRIGPVEFENRPVTAGAPWQPYQEPYQQWTPFFNRAHTDFSWSFYLRWRPQS